MKLNPYIMFNSNAEEALHMYAACFDGEVKGIIRYGEAPMPSPDNYKNKILHSTFVFGDNVIMVSDSMPGQDILSTGNIHLSVDIKDAAQMKNIFNKPAEGGKTTMPLQDTFWGARFGMLTDKLV